MKAIPAIRGASRQRIHRVSAVRVNAILNRPTRQQLRDELAEAVRNTAKLPIPTEEDTDASDH